MFPIPWRHGSRPGKHSANVMQAGIAQRLLDLNRVFYEKMATPFAQSRARPQPGFEHLINYLPRPCPRFLDVGCGEGRLGRFLLAAGQGTQPAITTYVGVDFTEELLAVARQTVPGDFHLRDLSRPDCLAGPFDTSVIRACRRWVFNQLITASILIWQNKS